MKGIIMNTDEVKAILDGRKTEIRRVIKPQPKARLCYLFAGHGSKKWSYPNKNAWKIWGEDYKLPDNLTEEDKGMLWTPPCHTDDILYVKETWHTYTKRVGEGEGCRIQEFYGYKASISNSEDAEEPWKSSIYMPREAARLFLKVKNVRVERLQGMPHDGAMKEGIHYDECPDGFTWKAHTDRVNCYVSPMSAMKAFWNSKIKKSDLGLYGWDVNPWVWVIVFERIPKEEAEKQIRNADPRY